MNAGVSSARPTRPDDRAVRAARPAAVAVAALGGLTYLWAVDPNAPGHYPGCPILAVTGLYCPGCGTLRALHALTHGDVLRALDLNALLVTVGLPVLVLGWAVWARREWTGRVRTTLAAPVWIWLLLVAVVGFAVLRNLPFASALAP